MLNIAPKSTMQVRLPTSRNSSKTTLFDGVRLTQVAPFFTELLAVDISPIKSQTEGVAVAGHLFSIFGYGRPTDRLYDCDSKGIELHAALTTPGDNDRRRY